MSRMDDALQREVSHMQSVFGQLTERQRECIVSGFWAGAACAADAMTDIVNRHLPKAIPDPIDVAIDRMHAAGHLDDQPARCRCGAELTNYRGYQCRDCEPKQMNCEQDLPQRW